MSNKISKQVGAQTKQFPLTDLEFQYITSLDNVTRSFEHYFRELKTAYLQTLTPRMGYTNEDRLELAIDLKDESHILTIKKLPIDN